MFTKYIKDALSCQQQQKLSTQIKQRCDGSRPNAIMSQEEKSPMGSPKEVLPLKWEVMGSLCLPAARGWLNITHYQRNANQNHNEVPLHASQDGCYPKVYKQ